MEEIDHEFVAGFRKKISDFLNDKIESRMKGSKGKGIDEEVLKRNLSFDNWITNAPKRGAKNKLQSATHILKGIHSSAQGTNLFCNPDDLPKNGLIGSYLLGKNYEKDFFAKNIAPLTDICQVFSLTYKGQRFDETLLNGNREAYAILSDNPDLAIELRKEFLFILSPGIQTRSSDTLAKQVFWLCGDDPCEDSQFHLLLPLFESSLVQKMFDQIYNDLFGEVAKEARNAKRKKEYSDAKIHEYPNLAVRKIGGSNTQNISPLNKRREGKNYLLCSAPPTWKESQVFLPTRTNSLFSYIGKRPSIKTLIQNLKKFLESDPPPNMKTRIRREDLVGQIVGEIFQYIEEIHEAIYPGWSDNSECRLSKAEKFFLDPSGKEKPYPDWQQKISQKFASWLNSELGQSLPMGDEEYLYFMDAINTEFWKSMTKKLKTGGIKIE